MSALAFDTETTGFKEPVKIIEAAWARLDSLVDLYPKEFWECRFDPQRSIEFGAMAAHHITNKDLEGKPLSETFSLPEGVDYLIGHNVDYDWGVIGKPPLRRICTLALSRLVWPQMDSFSLGAMVYMLEGTKATALLKDAHSAAADVDLVVLLLKHIVPNLPGGITTWEELWFASEAARIPEIMTFGKHKNMLIKDVPLDYIHWLIKQPDLEPYLEIALKRRLGRA
ncbi:MAG: hypothetical protein B7X10_04035 [Burkholderiales bacterium 21-58-4]|nr:MAG: hypothetical protein B7X10_04035 [Burkholderiales bacterium 21-58-4]